MFLSQQVGGRDLAELNQQLAAPPHTYTDWTLEAATRQVTAAGLRVLDSGEELVEATFRDVGAIVRLLLITPWEVPGFTVDAYRPRLQRLHEYLNRGPLTVHAHRAGSASPGRDGRSRAHRQPRRRRRRWRRTTR